MSKDDKAKGRQAQLGGEGAVGANTPEEQSLLGGEGGAPDALTRGEEMYYDYDSLCDLAKQHRIHVKSLKRRGLSLDGSNLETGLLYGPHTMPSRNLAAQGALGDLSEGRGVDSGGGESAPSADSQVQRSKAASGHSGEGINHQTQPPSGDPRQRLSLDRQQQKGSRRKNYSGLQGTPAEQAASLAQSLSHRGGPGYWFGLTQAPDGTGAAGGRKKSKKEKESGGEASGVAEQPQATKLGGNVNEPSQGK